MSSEMWLCQFICIYLKNNPAKFHTNPIWNDGAFGFFEEHSLNKNNNQVAIWDQFCDPDKNIKY